MKRNTEVKTANTKNSRPRKAASSVASALSIPFVPSAASSLSIPSAASSLSIPSAASSLSTPSAASAASSLSIPSAASSLSVPSAASSLSIPSAASSLSVPFVPTAASVLSVPYAPSVHPVNKPSLNAKGTKLYSHTESTLDIDPATLSFLADLSQLAPADSSFDLAYTLQPPVCPHPITALPCLDHTARNHGFFSKKSASAKTQQKTRVVGAFDMDACLEMLCRLSNKETLQNEFYDLKQTKIEDFSYSLSIIREEIVLLMLNSASKDGTLTLLSASNRKSNIQDAYHVSIGSGNTHNTLTTMAKYTDKIIDKLLPKHQHDEKRQLLLDLKDKVEVNSKFMTQKLFGDDKANSCFKRLLNQKIISLRSIDSHPKYSDITGNRAYSDKLDIILTIVYEQAKKAKDAGESNVVIHFFDDRFQGNKVSHEHNCKAHGEKLLDDMVEFLNKHPEYIFANVTIHWHKLDIIELLETSDFYKLDYDRTPQKTLLVDQYCFKKDTATTTTGTKVIPEKFIDTKDDAFFEILNSAATAYSEFLKEKEAALQSHRGFKLQVPSLATM